MCVDAERVAWNDHELVAYPVGDLVDDALKRGKPEREDDGIDALQRVAVLAGDNRSWTDLCGQPSCGLIVGTREPQALPA